MDSIGPGNWKELDLGIGQHWTWEFDSIGPGNWTTLDLGIGRNWTWEMDSIGPRNWKELDLGIGRNWTWELDLGIGRFGLCILDVLDGRERGERER